MSRLDNFGEILDSYEGREPVSDPSFDIEEFDTFYRVHGIQYDNEIVSYDFAKDALPDKTQISHLADAINAEDTEFRATDAPFIYALSKALYQNRNCPKELLVEKARNNIEGIISKDHEGIHTISRAILNDSDKFELIHEMENACFTETKLMGPGSYITDPKIQSAGCIQELLDTADDTGTVNAVFKWLVGKNTWVWRFDQKPEEFEWSVVFEIDENDKGDFGINLGRVTYERPALGVRQVQENSKESTGLGT